jgi:hypothetical protein
VGTRLYTERRSASDRFAAFQTYLGGFYDSDTPMYAVYCSSMPLVPSSIVEFTLGSISEVSDKLHQGVTIYIPATKVRDIEDQELMRAMDDVNYLEELTSKRLQTDADV